MKRRLCFLLAGWCLAFGQEVSWAATRGVPNNSMVVSAPQHLDALLAGRGTLVAWVQLPLASVPQPQLAALRQWVENGGALWTDTDVIRAFYSAPAGRRETTTKKLDDVGLVPVAATGIHHPVIEMFRGQQIRFAFRYPVVDIPAGRGPEEFTNLLYWYLGGRSSVVVCGIRVCGKGLVVYRPLVFGNRAFETKLLEFCLQHASSANVPDGGGRRSVARTRGQPGADAVSQLLEVMQDDQKPLEERITALTKLAVAWGQDRDHLSATLQKRIGKEIADFATDNYSAVKLEMVRPLSQVGPRPEALQALTGILQGYSSIRDDSPDIARAILGIVKGFGPAASGAAGEVKKFVEGLEERLAGNPTITRDKELLAAAKECLAAIARDGEPGHTPSSPPVPVGQVAAVNGTVLRAGIVVDARRGWTETGVTVQQGQVIAVNHRSGGWAVGAGYELVGANGHVNEGSTPLKNFQHIKEFGGAPFGCLLGAVGNTARPFALGAGQPVACPASGALLVRINDKDFGLADNVGSITVDVVTVGGGSQPPLQTAAVSPSQPPPPSAPAMPPQPAGQPQGLSEQIHRDTTQSLQELTARLQESDPKRRRRTLQDLESMGKFGLLRWAPPELAPALMRALEDADGFVRMGAIIILQWMPVEPVAVVPAIERAFAKPAGEGFNARLALATLPAYGSHAVPLLLRYFNDKDHDTRCAAIRAVADIGPAARAALPAVWELAKNAPLDMNAPMYCGVMVGIAPAQDVLPLLAQLMLQDGHRRQGESVLALLNYGPAAKPILPALRRAVATCRDTINRRNIATVIERIGPGAAEAVPELCQGLQPPDFHSPACAKALGAIGPAAAPAVGLLIRLAVSEKNREVCPEAVSALGQIGPAAASAIPTLTQLLMRQDAKGRQETLRALGQMGAAAKATTSHIIPHLRDNSPMVREAAATALGKLDPSDARVALALGMALQERQKMTPAAAASLVLAGAAGAPHLLAALRSESRETVLLAANALGDAGDAAVAPLKEALQDQEHMTRAAAAYALGKTGKPSAEKIALLVKGLNDEEPAVRTASARSLARFGPAPETVPVLTQVLDGKIGKPSRNADSGVQSIPFTLTDDTDAAAEALGAVAPASAEVLALIRATLKRNPRNAVGAAKGLGNMGPAAAVAAEELAASSAENFSSMQEAAMLALGKLGPGPAAITVPSMGREVFDFGKVQSTTSSAIGSASEFAANGLAEIGPSAIAAASHLRNALDATHRAVTEKDVRRRAAYANALGAVGGAPRSVPTLIATLKSNGWNARAAAARALGAAGPAGASAVPFLQRALETDEDGRVRAAAAEALARLGGAIK